MSYDRTRRGLRRRVYTIVGYTVIALAAAPAPAQVDLTVTPAMTKGPVGAPVTIVEFSDYQ